MPESLQSTIKHCSSICLLLVGQFEPKLNPLGLGEDGAGLLMVLGCLNIYILYDLSLSMHKEDHILVLIFGG